MGSEWLVCQEQTGENSDEGALSWAAAKGVLERAKRLHEKVPEGT